MAMIELQLELIHKKIQVDTTRSSRPELIDDSSDLPLSLLVLQKKSQMHLSHLNKYREGFCRRQGDGNENIDIEAARHMELFDQLRRDEEEPMPPQYLEEQICHLNTLKNR